MERKLRKGSPREAPDSCRKEKETRVDFLMVIMASGVDRGHVRAITAATESRNTAKF